MMEEKYKGKLFAIISAFTFAASSSIGAKIMHGGFSVNNLLFWRYFIASIVVSIIILFNFKNLQFNKNALLKAFITAVLFYSGSSALYFASFKFIGTGLSSAICFSHSLFVTMYAWYFDKQKITKEYLISFLLIVVGLIFLMKNKNPRFDYYGILLAILSALAYSVYIFSNRKKATNVSPLLSALMLFYGNCFIFFFTSYFDKSLKLPHNETMWMQVISIGTVCTILPIYFLLKALKSINASEVTILSVLRPVFALILGMVFLGETLNIYQIIGIVAILGGGLVIQMDKHKLPGYAK